MSPGWQTCVGVRHSYRLVWHVSNNSDKCSKKTIDTSYTQVYLNDVNILFNHNKYICIHVGVRIVYIARIIGPKNNVFW